MRATGRGLGDAAGASLRRRMTLYVTAQLLAMIDAWAGADSHCQTRLHGQRFTARKLAIATMDKATTRLNAPCAG